MMVRVPRSIVGEPLPPFSICRNVSVLILSMHDEERYVDEALKAGASGYVVKTQADTDLVAAVRAVERGEPTRQSLGREGFAVLRGGRLRFERAGKPSRRFRRSAN